MPVGAKTAGRKIALSDVVLATGEGYQDVADMRSGRDFTVFAIHVDSSSNQAEEALGYCTVDGYLTGENEQDRDTYRLYTRTPIGLAFKRIYSAGTTGRGIKLLDQR